MGAAGGEGTIPPSPRMRRSGSTGTGGAAPLPQPQLSASMGASERGWSAARDPQLGSVGCSGRGDLMRPAWQPTHRQMLQRSVSAHAAGSSWVVAGQPPDGASHFTRRLGGAAGGYVEAPPILPPAEAGCRTDMKPVHPNRLPWLHLLSALAVPCGQQGVTAVPSIRGGGGAHFRLSVELRLIESRASGSRAAAQPEDVAGLYAAAQAGGNGSEDDAPGSFVSDAGSDSRVWASAPLAAFRLMLAWEEVGEGRWRATALQAECDARGGAGGRWVLLLLEGGGPAVPAHGGGLHGAWLGGSVGSGDEGVAEMLPTPVTTVELATAKDSALTLGDWVTLELEVRKGEFVCVRRADTGVTLFSLTPCGPGSQVVAAAAVGVLHGGSPDGMLPRSAHTGVWGDGSAVVPLAGPMGLGVPAGCRLDFRSWHVAPLAAGEDVQGAGSTLGAGRGQQQRNGRAAEAGGPALGSRTSQGSLGSSGQQRSGSSSAGPPPGSPAAACEAFRGVSGATATAAAISATAAATFKWSRTPYVGDADPHLVEAVMADIVHPGDYARAPITYDDIASLDRAKRLLHEAVALPLLLPELFVGIREPWRGVLLFGPPGTGKTLLARAVACMAGATFFAPSSASLTSKWRGDSEKLVRTLFAVARHYAPSIIFLDEVDALVASRDGDSGEGDASRRFKAELLQQMDGLVSGMPTHSSARSGVVGGSHVMVLAATNCPWDLDGAMRRRMEKRIHVPLPDMQARAQLFAIHTRGLMLGSDVDVSQLAAATAGYSGADIKTVCREAAMAPLRRLLEGRSAADIRRLRGSLVGAAAGDSSTSGSGASASGGAGGAVERQLVVEGGDFEDALAHTQPSVSGGQVTRYEAWDREFCAM